MTVTRGRYSKSFVAILAQLVAQGPNGNAKNVGRVGSVPKAMLERINNQITFDIGHRAPNQGRRHGPVPFTFI